MANNLELIVKKRIKQAKAKGFAEKASLIAQELGHNDCETYHDCGETHVSQYLQVYETNTLKIVESRPNDWQGYCEAIRIIDRVSNNVLFEESRFRSNEKKHSIKAYIPGQWETEFEQIYESVRKNKKARDLEEAAKRKEDKDKSLRERFGI